MVKKCYLSGPITGNPNYLAFFAKHERELAAQGYEVMNPTKLDGKNPPPWHEAIIRDLGYILLCDVIALLPGWHASPGARIEVMFGIRMGKRFVIRPDAVAEMIFKVRANCADRNKNQEEEDIPWGNEDDLDEIDEKGFLDGGLDDIPGWE